MTTLSSGNSTTFSLSPNQSVTVTSSPGATGTIKRTQYIEGTSSKTDVLGPPETNQTYGPYGSDVDVELTSTSGDFTYVVNGNPYVSAVVDASTGGIKEITVSGNDAMTKTGNVGVRNSRGLRRWRAAMATAEYGIARINCLGDSVTLGAYSNDSSIPVDSVADAQGYVGRLRAMLARKYGSTAAGYMPANDSRNTLVGTGAVTSSVGPIINTVRTDNTTSLGGALPLPAAATISFPVPRCTNIEIIYLDSSTNSTAGGIGANTGTFSYSVDGGGSTTTTADNVNPVSYKRITLTGLSDATHTLLITGVTGTCYIAGINYYGANGVVVSRLGLGGGTCLDLTGEGVVTHLSVGSTQRILGALAASAAPVTITGSVTTGSPIVTGISSTAGLVVGMPVGASAQIALPCFLKSVDSSSQITLTSNATGDNAARTMYVGAGTTYTADLWIITIGHNDWQQQNSAYPTPVSVFKTQMKRIIDTLVAAGGCVLLVGEPDSNTTSPSPETYADSAYWTAIKELSDESDHVSAIQVNELWGTFENAKTLGLLSVAGGVHPLKKGAADMAQIIYRAIDKAPAE